MRVQTEDKRYVRDINSNALLATDIDELYKYREGRKNQQQHLKEFQQLRQDMNSLQSAVQLLNMTLMEHLDASKRSIN